MEHGVYENKGHGGRREGAGRKPKADELALIEKLSPLEDKALAMLEAGIDRGEFQFIKLFFEYKYGKPKDKLDVTTNGESVNVIRLVDVDGTDV